MNHGMAIESFGDPWHDFTVILITPRILLQRRLENPSFSGKRLLPLNAVIVSKFQIVSNSN